MESADFTKKEIADALAAYNRGEGFPDGTIFNPAGFARGDPILRKMTAEERRDAGLKPVRDASEKKEG